MNNNEFNNWWRLTTVSIDIFLFNQWIIRRFNCFSAVVVMAYLLVFQLCWRSFRSRSICDSLIHLLSLSVSHSLSFSLFIHKFISFTSTSEAITNHSLKLRCNITMQVSIGLGLFYQCSSLSLSHSLYPSHSLLPEQIDSNKNKKKIKKKKRIHYYIIVKMIIPIIISQFTTKYLIVSVFFSFLLLRCFCNCCCCCFCTFAWWFRSSMQ